MEQRCAVVVDQVHSYALSPCTLTEHGYLLKAEKQLYFFSSVSSRFYDNKVMTVWATTYASQQQLVLHFYNLLCIERTLLIYQPRCQVLLFNEFCGESSILINVTLCYISFLFGWHKFVPD